MRTASQTRHDLFLCYPIFFRAGTPQNAVSFVRRVRVLSAVHSLFFGRRPGRGRLQCAGGALRADRTAQVSFHDARPRWPSDGPFRTSIATTPFRSCRSEGIASLLIRVTLICTLRNVAFLARAANCLAVERICFCFGDAFLRVGERAICGE